MEKQKLIDYYIFRTENAIIYANNRVTKLEDKQLSIRGMSSNKIRILLNKLMEPTYTRYLEIGVWMGSTFTSALYGNSPECAISIDNFSEFAHETADDFLIDNRIDVERIFKQNLQDSGITNYKFINSDCFNLKPEDKESIKDIDVYLYDGGHSVDEHIKALTYYYDNLTDIFIFIVDDWNDKKVQEGTRLAYQKTGIKVHKEWELLSKRNGDTETWWNGYYLAVCEKVK